MSDEEWEESCRLDALIAEKIFNKTVEYVGTGKMITTTHPVGSPWILGENKYGYMIPYYSTDVKAAWEILEHLRPDFHFSIDTVPEGYQVQFVVKGNKISIGSYHYCTVRAETAPLAICLAALKALGIEYKEQA
jgi:hypothetical protein